MNNLLSNAFDFADVFSNIVEKWYMYVGLAVIIVGIAVLLFVVKPKRKVSVSNTQKIVYIALLTALCTAVNVLTYYPVSYIAISFTATVCFLAGFLLGAKAGFAVGFIGDLIGAILFPQGVYNPLIGLASGLMGLIPGVVFDYFGGNRYLKVVISAVLCLIICTSGLNTLGLYLIYGLGKKTFWAYLIVRLPWQVLVSAGNCALCILLAGILPKILSKRFGIQK